MTRTRQRDQTNPSKRRRASYASGARCRDKAVVGVAAGPHRVRRGRAARVGVAMHARMTDLVRVECTLVRGWDEDYVVVAAAIVAKIAATTTTIRGGGGVRS